ncbi:MAG: hypothetical protein MUF22_07720 [Chitinispirillaceae bacterium]|nr:hypothetical protein [Chitinispirillaceae bacterium]
MTDLMTLTLLDFSAIVTLMVLGYLSRRLGDALKIRAYYLLMYISAVFVAVACGIDLASGSLVRPVPLVTLSIRCGACVIGIGVCLRYWQWLFSEFFGE